MDQIRWHKVIGTCLVLSVGAIAAVTLGDQILHRIRVAQADGVWCVQASSSGALQRAYGEQCE